MYDVNNEWDVIGSRDIEEEIVRLEKKVEILKELRNKFSKGFPEDTKEIHLIRDSFFVHYTKIETAEASDVSV